MLKFGLHILIWLLFFAPLNAYALDIEDIRFGVHPDKTRLVIEISESTNFRSFVLPQTSDKPYRLVVDLPTFNWKAGQIDRPPKTSVTDVRSGILNANTKRVVVDLNSPIILKNAFILSADRGKPNRLVIDFVKTSANEFASTERKVFGNLKDRSAEEPASALTNLIQQQFSDEESVKSSSGIVIPQRKPNTTITSSAPAASKSPLRKPLIVIDAGHGGADPGAVGDGRSYEKHVTLAAAKNLKKKLEDTGRYRVILTRDNDTYLKLYQRRDIARKKDADLFISLHADSIDKPNVRGASIYTLSNKASDAQTARLAARENQVDLLAGVDLSHEDKDVANILIDLAMRDTMNQSKFFANTVVDHMRGNGIRILPKPHRYAGFAVLKSPDVPSVLVEMGFMSNKSEARLLKTRDYQDKIATALTKSIDSYFQKVRQNSLQ
jgi:N-acetylmuramoyl-L-alanine amidase